MSDPLPEPPSNQNVRDAEWFDKGWKAAMRRIAEGEQEARTLARTEVIAEAVAAVEEVVLPPSQRAERGDYFEGVMDFRVMLLAALSRLGERE
jgi:hypothetical protein